MLQGHQYSIYQASSLQILQSVVHKNEQYLLLIHQPFVDLQTIGILCRKSEVYKVFVLSDTPGKDDGIVLLQRGVVGYANTYISKGRFVEAVKTVQSGRVWFNQEVLAEFIQSSGAGRKQVDTEESQKFFECLTQREREIAGLIAGGLSNKNIGERLYISERTVKSHLGTIFQKTGAKSRVQLALLIQRYRTSD